MNTETQAGISYFAYGSNLYSPRLRFRVPSCRVISTATLSDHRLVFHKRSDDGSLKCDALAHAGGKVLGVIYAIDRQELPDLRSAEGAGKGYDEMTVAVTDSSGTLVTALTYLAAPTHIKNDLPVYGWYRDFVLMGCREHEFPEEYIDGFVKRIAAVHDPKLGRDKNRRAEVKGDPIRIVTI